MSTATPVNLSFRPIYYGNSTSCDIYAKVAYFISLFHCISFKFEKQGQVWILPIASSTLATLPCDMYIKKDSSQLPHYTRAKHVTIIYIYIYIYILFHSFLSRFWVRTQPKWPNTAISLYPCKAHHDIAFPCFFFPDYGNILKSYKKQVKSFTHIWVKLHFKLHWVWVWVQTRLGLSLSANSTGSESECMHKYPKMVQCISFTHHISYLTKVLPFNPVSCVWVSLSLSLSLSLNA
jgi:hypothetical protein